MFSDVSITVPLFAISPELFLTVSPTMLREPPTPNSIIGEYIISLGMCCLNYTRSNSLLSPLRTLSHFPCHSSLVLGE